MPRLGPPASGATPRHGLFRLATALRRILPPLLGALLAVSGASKLRDPQFFAFSLKAFDLDLPKTVIVQMAYVIPWIEIVLGGALLTYVWARPGALAATLLFLGFSAALSSVLLRGLNVTCACFGSSDVLCQGPVGTCHLMRSVALAALSLWVTLTPHRPSAE